MKRQVNACRLLTPGPVSIESSVLEAMTCCPSPADAAFISMMEDVRSRLLRVAGMRPAEYAAVLMAGPCAFALEAALTTLIPEESRVLVVCNGARAEAACRMLARADIAFEKLETGFEQAAGAAEIAMLLDERPDITHVAVVHVDAGVSFGATSIDAEALGIDVLLSVADCGLKGVSGLSFVLARRVLDIIVSTGVVSNLVTHTEYYYNSSLAHCFYNASMVLPSAHAHLHGEVVSFGNLVLLAYDGQDELLERFLDFNTSIGLPVTLAQVGITTDEQLMKLVSAAEHIKEWSTGPEPAVREQFVAAIRKVDTLGAARLAAAA